MNHVHVAAGKNISTVMENNEMLKGWKAGFPAFRLFLFGLITDVIG